MGLPLASASGTTIVPPHQIMLDDSSSFLGWLVGLALLVELARNAQAARSQVAHLTRIKSDLQIHAATEQVGAMEWQVTEMQKINARLEG
jgi:hypothetical protein